MIFDASMDHLKRYVSPSEDEPETTHPFDSERDFEAEPPLPIRGKEEQVDEEGANPPLPSRQTTLNRFPQFLFSSRWNMIPANYEIPYAFNHHYLSFYWTRADALVDAKFNIYVRPPCLNCIVACDGDMNGDLARLCAGTEKHKWDACVSCASKGKKSTCIEQIEVRKDSSPCGGGKQSDPQMVIWTDRERTLRKMGIVEWRPINLKCGDVDGKEYVVEKWDLLKQKAMQLDERQNWALPVLSREMTKVLAIGERTTQGPLIKHRESDRGREYRLQLAAVRVAEWDKEDRNLSGIICD